MATKAKKLPSGKWRSQVSYMQDGKRHYKSFTAPTKKESEAAAAAFELEKGRLSSIPKWTLREAMSAYIEKKRPVLSPTTIQGYEKVLNYSFQDILDTPISAITDEILQTAVANEMNRPREKGTGTQSAKSVRNAYGFVAAVLNEYLRGTVFRVDLPKSARQIRTLPEPKDIFNAVRGTKIELPVLLAMWLSFSLSEIRGLTKSKSIDGDYITIREVKVWAGSDITKALAKTDTRIRRHKIPPYVKKLIDNVEGDEICPLSPTTLRWNLKKCLNEHNVQNITFHDLRHVNASVMAALRIPDKYAQERGGWASDNVMKRVYTETFSEEREKADGIIDDYFSSFAKLDNANDAQKMHITE